MHTQQNEKSENITKPKLLLLSFVFVCIQLALAIALLILLAVMNYFGFQFPGISHQISSDASTVCTDQYISIKYGSNTRYYVSVGFVASCVSLLFALILFIAFLKIFITTRKIMKSDDHRLLKATKIRVLSLFIGVTMTRFIYIMQSFVFGGSIIVFGVYFNFLVEFPFSCSFVYNTEEILAITCVSGALLLISMIAWFFIVCLATDVQNQLFSDDDWTPKPIKKNSELMKIDREQTYEDLKEETKEKQYENKFIEYSHQKNQQQSKQNFKKTYQQKQQSPKESKRIFKKTQSPKYQPKNNTHYQYQKKDQEFYDQYRQDKPLDNPNKYWQSPSRFNNKNNQQSPDNTNNRHSIFRSRKYLYESPYQQIEESSYHRPTKSPKQNSRRGRDLLFEEEEAERAQKKSYHAENQDRYVEERQNRYIEENQNRRQISHSNFEQNQDKNSYKNSFTHSNSYSQNTYFKDSKNNQNLRNTPNTPKRRRGILNDYIRGKYVE